MRYHEFVRDDLATLVGAKPVEVVAMQLLLGISRADENCFGLAHPVVPAVLLQDPVGQAQQQRGQQDLVHEGRALHRQALDTLRE